MQSEDAALILARLIQFGFAAELPENLPPEWRVPYDAVRAVPASDHYQRAQAFTASLAEDPARFHMELELEQATHNLQDQVVEQLRVYSGWETLDPPPAQQACVTGIFTKPSLNLLVGAPGAKKTWLAFDLAVSVATGQPWLGHETEATPVLIVDEEGGLQRTWERLARVLRGHQAPRQTPVHFIPPSGFDFAQRGSSDSLAARARSLGAGLIIIDALINVMPGSDENNVLSVQPVLANLRRLAREANATVVVIHHTNKQGIFRGSTSLSSGVDHLLAVESAAQDNLVQLATIKARDIEPVSITARCNFQPSTFALSLTEDLPKVKLGSSARALLSRLAQLGSATPAQLSTSKLTSSTTRSLIRELVAAGLIERTNPGTRGTPAQYSLTSRSQNSLGLSLSS